MSDAPQAVTQMPDLANFSIGVRTSIKKIPPSSPPLSLTVAKRKECYSNIEK